MSITVLNFWCSDCFVDVDGVSFGLFGHDGTKCPCFPHEEHRDVEGS